MCQICPVFDVSTGYSRTDLPFAKEAGFRSVIFKKMLRGLEEVSPPVLWRSWETLLKAQELTTIVSKTSANERVVVGDD